MSRVCHKLIAETAKGIAQASWEIMSSNDVFHRAWPKVRPFVVKHWPDFIGHARASLTVMLAQIKPGSENDPSGPEYVYSEHVRNEIYEALLEEGAGKANPAFMQAPSAAEIARYGGLN